MEEEIKKEGRGKKDRWMEEERKKADTHRWTDRNRLSQRERGRRFKGLKDN